MGTLKRRWIESMEPKREPPMEQERLQSGDPGYTAGISADGEAKPTLTGAEREALENAVQTLRDHDAGHCAMYATLRGLLERLTT
jgi:hypothetical protein